MAFTSLHKTSTQDVESTLNLRQVFEFATQTPIEQLEFINEARTLNEQAAKDALKGNYGHELGKTLSRPLGKGIMGDKELWDLFKPKKKKVEGNKA